MAGRTLQSTIEIAGTLSPSLQQAIRQAVDRLEEMSQETLESAGAAARLADEIGAQESVLRSLQRGYADYIVSGQEGSDEARQLAERIQDLSDELEENRDTLEAAQRAAEQLAESQDETADSYDRLQRQITAQESDLAALRRAYANVVLEQGENSDEAQRLAGEIDRLSGDLNENRQRLNDAEQAADRLGDSLEDAGQQAEDSSEGYTVLKNVIANLATDTIEKAVEAFKELATEGDSALGMLEARTGATGTEMEGFKDVMYEVYNANYGESLGDVSEKLGTVIQMTDDLDNASLAKVTKSAIALEDVFGFDVTESMRAVNSLMDQFGISSDQAFNLVVQGAQKGLNQNDDLLDTINEYSVQFKNAGYSADDMFNMLANGAESGTWSIDKLGDAVKEFNIRMSDGTANEYLEKLGLDVDDVIGRFNKGGPEAQGAIGDVMKALQNCDDATEQYAIGVGLFGTMWEDLGVDTVASLMDTQGAIDSTADAMAQMDSAAYDTLESSLSQLGRTIKAEVVQPIAEKLIPVIKNAVNYINTNVGPAVEWLLNHLPEVGIVLGSLGAIVAAMKWSSIVAKLGAIKGAISGLITAIGGISAPVLAVIAVVAALVAAFTHLWRTNDEFRAKITGIWEGIKSKFDEFGQGIVDRLNALGFDFENFGEVVGAIWDGFCSLLAPIFEGVFQQISNILSAALDILTGIFDIFAGIFTGDWDMVWQGVQEVFGAVWDFVVNTFKNWIDTFKGLADTVLGWFGTSWEEVWGNVKSFFEGIWNGITSFISNTLNGIKNTFTSIWDAVTGFLSNAWETIKNVVQTGIMFVAEIINAAFQLITLPFRFIWENCKETVTAAWEKIKTTISGALDAIKNWISGKMEAAKAVFTSITTAISNVASSAWNAISSTASTVWESIKGAISSKIQAAQAVVSSVTGAIKNVASSAWNAISSTTSSIWNTITSTISSKVNAAKSTVTSVFNGIKSAISSALSGALSTVNSIFSSIHNAISSKIQAAKNVVSSAISAIKSAFNFSWSLPKLKLPHISISGSFSLTPPSVPKFGISWYKEGGILTQPTIFGASGNNLLAGGEAGAEAVVPLATLWEKLDTMIHSVFNAASTTGEPSGEGLTSIAGKLLTLDDFSLGSLANNTSTVIYYDFSGFTWSPQIQTGGTGNDDTDDFMAQLRAHEAEFFDWLEEFIQAREVAAFA